MAAERITPRGQGRVLLTSLDRFRRDLFLSTRLPEGRPQSIFPLCLWPSRPPVLSPTSSKSESSMEQQSS